MGGQSDIKMKLEQERERLYRMINNARETHEPNSEAILEQSRKVDDLLAKVQKAHMDRGGKANRPRNGQER